MYYTAEANVENRTIKHTFFFEKIYTHHTLNCTHTSRLVDGLISVSVIMWRSDDSLVNSSLFAFIEQSGQFQDMWFCVICVCVYWINYINKLILN